MSYSLSEIDIRIKLLWPLEMVLMMSLWFWRLMSVLVLWVKKANRLPEVLTTQLVNLNIWSLFFSSMDVRPTEEIHIWFFTLSTKISCMWSLSSTWDSPLHSVDRHSMINLSISSITSLWLPCQSCGMQLSTLSMKEEEKELNLKMDRNNSWEIQSYSQLVLIESASPCWYSSSIFYMLYGIHGFVTSSATTASIKSDTTT